MLWIYRFIFGYLNVDFSGDIAETILNLSAKQGISLWNSKRKKNKINCNMMISDFLRLPKIIKGKGLRVHILKKVGLPFFIKRYKKRYGIGVGIILFFAILKIFSSFLWSVNVVGNTYTKEADIIKACNEIGVKEGTYKNNIDTGILKQKLLLKVESLAWASFNIEGCKLTVNVSEPQHIAKKEKSYTNLKASADGVIKKIDITSGTAVVSVGDVVKKGDLLVSGVIENPNSTRFVHSTGSVIAETKRDYTFSLDYNQKLFVKTGKRKEKQVLYVFGLKIPLFLGCEKGKFESYGSVEQAKILGEKLPIKLYKRNFEYLKEENVKFTTKQLEDKLSNLLDDKIKQQKITNYNIVSAEFSEDKKGITLKSKISAVEDIAKQEILLISIGNQ